ncbi:helix-turn-helix domain-containing protein [Acetobacter sp.]|jgi:predicted transcriptional regulator/plasmid maintenance system antidote protein VapI|uniref:helix-turn-helix domain-containing protein n=1 Tax=Acetobacter sp. TaxID=440 RepID=UPI0025B7D15E|nr:helix-turn-helix domain-containing protein [Acetobacter sp.]MCH4090365.1 short-chain fatty acyl-CoA regulator family protein [Acetobacter sp.]MCI1299059.1 short-chain fatty acyl-CoA regulator family protein [Acetobacter sp.]MCI1315606.1 short-chain fatty acyl-CoA regulator family protein [Acetobacter sp.]
MAGSSSTRIGRIVRRLRQERELSQQALAARLGISASYLNLIEHDQRSVTATLLIKFTRALDVSIEALSGSEEQKLEAQLREALSDPELGNDMEGTAHEVAAVASQAHVAKAILALHQAYRAARHDAEGMALPGGRRLVLPQEEVRKVYDEHRSYFPALEEIAEVVREEMARDMGSVRGEGLPQAEVNHAVASRLRQKHGVVVQVLPLDDALRRYDPVTRQLVLSDLLPRESRGFQLAFQLMLLEARDVVEALLTEMEPSTKEARTFLQIGLTNYAAAAVLMPYMAFLKMAVANRYDMEVLSFRFGVSYQQAAQRLASLQRPGARGVPFFFVRTDPAGNISKSFSACGFPIPRQGNPCPQWNACTAFTTLGQIKTQIVTFTTGQSFLSIARSSMGMAQRWGDARPIRTITIGCDLSRARELVYSDHLNLDAHPTSIGISCHLCDWEDCRSRAFPPLNHRLIPDINERVLRPIPFEGP